MFLRFKQEENYRTINLAYVTQVYRMKQGKVYSVRVELENNYAIVGYPLSEEKAIELENKIIDAWIKTISPNYDPKELILEI